MIGPSTQGSPGPWKVHTNWGGQYKQEFRGISCFFINSLQFFIHWQRWPLALCCVKSPKSPLCKEGSCGGTRELTKSAPGRISCARPNSLALTSTVWKQNQQQVSILPFQLGDQRFVSTLSSHWWDKWNRILFLGISETQETVKFTKLL
jgi:hypothetical protein